MRLGYHEEPYIPSLFYLPAYSADVLWGENAEEMLEEDPAGIVDVGIRISQFQRPFFGERIFDSGPFFTAFRGGCARFQLARYRQAAR
ncbi:MAG: hypothetical protein ACT4QB_16260 [Gammaproteobacteria bacterium]